MAKTVQCSLRRLFYLGVFAMILLIVNGTKLKKTSSTKLTTSYQTHTSDGAISCCAACNKDWNCMGVSYKRSTGQCELSTDVSLDGQSDPEWDVYMATIDCFAEWTRFGRSCFRYFEDQKTWDEAKTHCETFDAHLAIITTDVENEFVKSMLDNISNSHMLRFIWIGGSDMETEGVWRWEPTGELLTFTNWGDKQPDNYLGQQDCLAISNTTNYLWKDKLCTRPNEYICEMDEPVL